MSNMFVGIGGSGQNTAWALNRLGEMMPTPPRFKLYHMDRDTQKDFARVTGSIHIDPLPAGAATTFHAHFHSPGYHEFCTDILDALYTTAEQQTKIATGMYARPAVGAPVIMDMLTRSLDPNLSSLLGSLADGNRHVVVICASGVGGTGASGGPSLARHIDHYLKSHQCREKVNIYLIYFLRHFTVNSPEADTRFRLNAESGMCFLKHHVADGADACLLLGSNSAPPRPYQDVGHQTEQPHPFYLIAALYTLRMFTSNNGNLFQGRINCHTVDLEPVGSRIVARDLGIGVTWGRNAIPFETLIQFNLACRDMCMRLKRLLENTAGFAFVSPFPPALSREIRRIAKAENQTDAEILSKLAQRMETKANQISELVHHHHLLCKENLPFCCDEPGELSGRDFDRTRRKPMKFIRFWASHIKRPGAEENDRLEGLFARLISALHQSVDQKFFDGRVM